MAATAVKDFIVAAKTDQLNDRKMISVAVQGKEVLIARVQDKYYAADNICPHMGAPLAMGTLEGTILTCPRHHSRFDLIDGKVIRWTDWTGIKAATSKLFRPPRPLTIFPVKVEGENILVKVM